MHRPHRITAKISFTRETNVPPSAFVPVFHRWIQRGATDQLLIDVHNYAHVHQGTGILLVGHEGDYAIDQQDGKTGLLYRLKRGNYQSLSAAVHATLRRLAQGVLLLEKDFALKGKVRVDGRCLELAIPDRLGYPNTAETFAEIEDEITNVFASVNGPSTVALERIDNDPREPLAIRVTVPDGIPVAALAEDSAPVGATPTDPIRY